VTRFKLGCAHANITDNKAMSNYFQLMLGDEAHRRFMQLRTGENQTMEQIYEFMGKEYVAQRCPYAESVVFSNAKRRSGESISEFVTRLVELAEHCGFTSREEHLLPQFVTGCELASFQIECTRGRTDNSAWTFEKAVELAKRHEKTADNMRKMTHPSGSEFTSDRFEVNFTGGKQGSQEVKCVNCGLTAHRDMTHCPARDRDCNLCGVIGHYRSVCKQKGQQGRSDNRPSFKSKEPDRSFRGGGKSSRVLNVTFEDDEDGSVQADKEREYADFWRGKSAKDFGAQ
jgi:hypothetical protein